MSSVDHALQLLVLSHMLVRRHKLGLIGRHSFRSQLLWHRRRRPLSFHVLSLFDGNERCFDVRSHFCRKVVFGHFQSMFRRMTQLRDDAAQMLLRPTAPTSKTGGMEGLLLVMSWKRRQRSVQHEIFLQVAEMRRSGERIRPSRTSRNISLSLKRSSSSSSKNAARRKRQLFDSLGEELDIESLKDWYRVSPTEINIDGTLFNELSVAYPEHDWKPWLFQQRVPHGYWDSEENRLEYLRWLGDVLGFKTMADWYNITKKDILDNCGSRILQKYSGSPSKMIQTAFASHHWDSDEWRKDRHRSKGADNFISQLFPDRVLSEDDNDRPEMKTHPRTFYLDPNNWKRLFEFLESEFKITKPEEWYRVSQQQISQFLPIPNAKKYEELIAELLKFYPLHKWEKERFYIQGQKKASQRMLRVRVEKLFPQSGDFDDLCDPIIQLIQTASLNHTDI